MQAKTSYGHDNVSNKVLKHVKEEISKPLTHLVNLSLTLDYTPDSWKCGRILPAHKSGPKTDPGNFRPICLIPTAAKVLERAVVRQIRDYMDQHGFWYKNQFAYRKRHNCQSLLLKYTDFVARAKRRNEHCVSIMIDLRKAFDVISHSTLFKILDFYGLPRKWFESYFSNRQQFVNIAEVNSESIWTGILGIGQGTVIGPLAFALYTNLLPVL